MANKGRPPKHPAPTQAMSARAQAWTFRFLALLPSLLGTSAIAAEKPYPLTYDSPEIFSNAIEAAEANTRVLPQRITGITVPHHLLAADMIASTLRMASGGKPARIIILTPDHFRRGTTPGSTTTRSFLTTMGPVPIDEPAARALATQQGFSLSDLFSHEHGVQALLPFIARWFPGVPVLPVALDACSTRADWQALADAMTPLVTRDTLIIQSTDFSHYLPEKAATANDRQTLRLLTTGDPSRIEALDQPAHLDSKAAQWIQMTLQQKVFRVPAPVVAKHRNAIHYGGRPNEPRTTSYITQFYSPDFIAASHLPGEAWFFGGDIHFGRHLHPNIAPPGVLARARAKILAITNSRPLIVNLEGVLLDGDTQTYQHPMRIGMPAAPTLEHLKQLGVTAVSIANNHTLDFGMPKRDAMVRLLTRHAITVLDAGPPVAIGPFLIGVATDLANHPAPARHILTESSFAAWLPAPHDKPLFAFLHAGIEYASAPNTRTTQLATWAEQAGASLIIGCHPHRPSPAWQCSAHSLRFLSMGNLLFDQPDPANTGGLIEVRFFQSNTWSARWIPTGNLYINEGK